MTMMGGGRGQEASVLEGLIAFGRDPKAMADRLEQLKAAQDAADDRVVKAAEVEAVNAKRTDELASLAADLDRRKKTLDDLQERLNQADTDIFRRSAMLDERETALAADKAALDADRKTFNDGLSVARARHETEAATLDARDVAITNRELEIQDIQRDLMKRSEALDASEADFSARQEAVRQALASVSV